MCPEIILHSEAEYIFADCSRRTRFFLQFSGGPYILRQLSHAALGYPTPACCSASKPLKF